jgi:hypothetical protein
MENKIVITSTPTGNNHFYELCKSLEDIGYNLLTYGSPEFNEYLKITNEFNMDTDKIINVGTIGHYRLHGKSSIVKPLMEKLEIMELADDVEFSPEPIPYIINVRDIEPYIAPIDHFNDNGRSTWADTKKRHNRRK